MPSPTHNPNASPVQGEVSAIRQTEGLSPIKCDPVTPQRLPCKHIAFIYRIHRIYHARSAYRVTSGDIYCTPLLSFTIC